MRVKSEFIAKRQIQSTKLRINIDLNPSLRPRGRSNAPSLDFICALKGAELKINAI